MKKTINHQEIVDAGKSDKKIIFIMPHHPTIDFHSKYFINELQSNDFSIAYWDVGAILDYDMKFKSTPLAIEYIKIDSLKELKLRLKHERVNDTIFIPQISRNLQSLPIYILLWCFNKKTAFFGRGYLPFVSQPKKKIRDHIINVLTKKNNLSSFFYSAIFKCLPVVKKHDITFVAGKLAGEIHQKDSIKISKIHHYDIDLTQKKDVLTVGDVNDFVVFIDDYLPFHPDFLAHHSKVINPEIYYASLNAFFDKIEMILEKKVVIAAHPKANYTNNPFNGRSILFNDTNFLVKNSAAVFAHASTAISYAVIYDKPLCLIYSQEIKETHSLLYNQMLMTAQILNCHIFNFDENINSLHLEMTVDKTKYREYYREFLSDEVSTLPSSKIVIDEINSLFTTNS